MVLCMEKSKRKCSLLVNPGTDRFLELNKPMPMHIPVSEHLIGFSMCSYENRFAFVLGGQLRGNHIDKVVRFDLMTDVWEELPSLNKSRFINSTCTLNDKMYIYGGSTIERLERPGQPVDSMGQWEKIIVLPSGINYFLHHIQALN